MGNVEEDMGPGLQIEHLILCSYYHHYNTHTCNHNHDFFPLCTLHTSAHINHDFFSYVHYAQAY